MLRALHVLSIGVLLAVLPGACASDNPYGFLPLPYQPTDKGLNRTSMLVLSDHIVVPPVRGLGEIASTILVDALVASLLKREVIATRTAPRLRTSRLLGEVASGPGRMDTIRWTLLDPYGTVVDDFTLPLPASLAREAVSSTVALRSDAASLAEDAARRALPRGTVPRMVEETRPAPVLAAAATPLAYPVQRGAGAEIIVTAIFGAPFDGAGPLREGVAEALRASGFVVADRPGPETLQLQCTVSLSESRPGFERLVLAWELKSPDGKVLASIDQANDIPAGSLDGGWQDLVRPVTQGAASGISEYFASQKR